MPELPEVETIRRVLEPQLQNRTIEKVTVITKMQSLTLPWMIFASD